MWRFWYSRLWSFWRESTARVILWVKKARQSFRSHGGRACVTTHAVFLLLQGLRVILLLYTRLSAGGCFLHIKPRSTRAAGVSHATTCARTHRLEPCGRDGGHTERALGQTFFLLQHYTDVLWMICVFPVWKQTETRQREWDKYQTEIRLLH